MSELKNAKVCCIAIDATPMQKELATRIIPGNLLPPVGTPGRQEAAKDIYNRMFGIYTTIHPYAIEDTDDPVPEPVPDVNTPVMEKYKTKVAKEASEGIAQAIVEATTRIAKPATTKVERNKL